MSTFSKPKWMLAVLLLLLASNIATLVYMWLPPRPPKGKAGRRGFELLVKELKMTDSQQTTYAKLREEHQAFVRPLRQKLKNRKDAFFDLLKTDTASVFVIESAAAKSAAIQQQLDMASFDHFKKLRAVCTPEQQKDFDKLIQDVIRQMAPPQGGGRPGGPPPNGLERRPGDPPPPGPPNGEPDGNNPPPHNRPPQ